MRLGSLVVAERLEFLANRQILSRWSVISDAGRLNRVSGLCLAFG